MQWQNFGGVIQMKFDECINWPGGGCVFLRGMEVWVYVPSTFLTLLAGKTILETYHKY